MATAPALPLTPATTSRETPAARLPAARAADARPSAQAHNAAGRRQVSNGPSEAARGRAAAHAHARRGQRAVRPCEWAVPSPDHRRGWGVCVTFSNRTELS